MSDQPVQSAFPLVVSRRVYDLAVKEGVDPAMLQVAATRCQRRGCDNETELGRRYCEACRRPPCMEPGCEAPRAPYVWRCAEHRDAARCDTQQR